MAISMRELEVEYAALKEAQRVLEMTSIGPVLKTYLHAHKDYLDRLHKYLKDLEEVVRKRG